VLGEGTAPAIEARAPKPIRAAPPRSGSRFAASERSSRPRPRRFPPRELRDTFGATVAAEPVLEATALRKELAPAWPPPTRVCGSVRRVRPRTSACQAAARPPLPRRSSASKDRRRGRSAGGHDRSSVAQFTAERWCRGRDISTVFQTARQTTAIARLCLGRGIAAPLRLSPWVSLPGPSVRHRPSSFGARRATRAFLGRLSRSKVSRPVEKWTTHAG
jgi:hypothetical protein